MATETAPGSGLKRLKQLRLKQLRRERLNKVGSRVRAVLVVIDVVYFAVACAIIGLGTRLLITKDTVIAIFGYSTMSSAAAVIISGGAVISVVAFCGIAAVVIRNKPLMLAQISAVVLILILTLVGGALAIKYKIEISERVKQEMHDSLIKLYGVDTGRENNAHITEVWDKLQTDYYCCGVEAAGWLLYRQSAWFSSNAGLAGVDKPYVPVSCCVYNHHWEYLDTSKCTLWEQGPPGLQVGTHNEALHYRGCFEASGMLGLVWFTYVAAASFLASVILVIGLILSVSFYRQLGAGQDAQ